MLAPQPRPNLQTTVLRPIGAYALQGIAFAGSRLIALDSARGYLLEIDHYSDNTSILNPDRVAQFEGAIGLALWEDTLWFTKDENVYFCSWTDLTPQHFVTLPYPADGVTVWESTVYVSCQKAGYVLIYNRTTGNLITQFYTPGIGVEHLTVRGEEIWVSDNMEQTVYCLERATGEIQFSILTPFENPTGLAFYTDPQTGEEILYVAYAGEEPYIRDDPNAEPAHQLEYRDRTFIHPLHFNYNKEGRYALSNGFLIEMSYVEELLPLEAVYLEKIEWRIALPSETDRQKVRQITAVGRPFTEEIVDGQRVAVFKFDKLKPDERHLFGWRALLEVYSIKYRLSARDIENIPDLSPEWKQRYLVDDDELAMDTDIIRSAASEAIGTETNLLRKAYKIRNYVYDKLSYAIKPHIDSPDVALQRGTGSCGEYVGLLLALFRLNGIACRTIGRYKCPQQADLPGVPLYPDYNHVWLEFYVPGFGWLPMESNPDDVIDRGPYPSRFFMGLAWYHIEIGKGITFEKLNTDASPMNKDDVSIGDLAINHIRFTILQELGAGE
ncbi:transglutaminase-like domain-containing protein [Argonema galeatum]|uniref:transglutaminase-like domain-containing protein n=1 Tax=Argonema galeatum TaxID=2942762 RepID=UPI002011FC31|nr:transglutaminase family protein [Argonema galeatum]MCL1463383.1 transglutaminase family protein [Argonema galeatum A003/A1]